jgi:UPF0271 protein
VRIDLNADVGESSAAAAVGDDAGMMASITSANIAAGFHGGNPTVLRQTIRLAKAHGVAVGAHPGLADAVGFGRRETVITPVEAEDLVLYQVAAVAGVAAAEGVRLRHVKPHGALYNMAARDPALASAIARAVRAADPALILVGLAGSALVEAGRAAGLTVASEGFADRAYERDGSLVSRDRAGAVLVDPDLIVARAVRMVTSGQVSAADGTPVHVRIDTLCLHGDTPGAALLALAVRRGLESAGVRVVALP